MTDLSRDLTPPSPWLDLDAYVALPRLGALTLSPDGSTLLCAVQALDAEKTAYTSSLWRVDPAGERAATRYTRSVQGEAAAGFLPDGSLLFTSKRDVPAAGEDAPKKSTTALWCLPAGGGEAYVLARRDGGWGQVLTTPDADTVVLSVLMHRGAEDEEADAALREARQKKKVSALLHTGYPVRYWDHDLGAETTRLKVATLNGEGDKKLDDLRDLTGDVGRAVEDAVLSRDGRTVVATWGVAGRGGETASELVAIDVVTGERRVLASSPDHEFGSPVISDDSRTVVCVRVQKSTPTSPPVPRLYVIDLATGQGRVLADDWDRWPSPVAFSPDGATVYATADEDGAAPIFAVSVADATPRRLTEDGAHSSVVRSPDGSTLFALRASYLSPGEVVAVDVASGSRRCSGRRCSTRLSRVRSSGSKPRPPTASGCRAGWCCRRARRPTTQHR